MHSYSQYESMVELCIGVSQDLQLLTSAGTNRSLAAHCALTLSPAEEATEFFVQDSWRTTWQGSLQKVFLLSAGSSIVGCKHVCEFLVSFDREEDRIRCRIG
jgi:hypothetical protein